MEFWERMARPGPDAVTLGGVELRRGSRVRLRPSRSADLFDRRLAGLVGTVEGFDEEHDGEVHVSVTIEDDPGRALGESRHPGHRFFFRLEEVEPLAAPSTRVLIAGIGNVFLGDNGYGVAAAHKLTGEPRRPGVEVVDFGIRGLDLAYALQSAWDGVVLLDATPRGGSPGTLYVIEPNVENLEDAPLETHGMNPTGVLALARTLGRSPQRVLVVGCEPGFIPDHSDPEALSMELSPPVKDAVERTIPLIESILAGWCGAADGREPKEAP